MERDYGNEIDSLRAQMERLQGETAAQLEKLSGMVASLLPNSPPAEKLERVHVMRGMHPDERLSDMMRSCAARRRRRARTGS